MPIQNIFDSHAHYNDGRFDADRRNCLLPCLKTGCGASSTWAATTPPR